MAVSEIKRYAAEPYDARKYRLAESPFFDERTGVLSFVDILSGKFFLIGEDKKIKEVDAGQMIGALVPWDAPGAYMAAMTDGLYLYEGTTLSKHCDLTKHYKPWQRSNDAKRDPSGRLFFGSTTFVDEKGIGGDLYCYDNGDIKIIRKDTKIANGMAWSSDNTKFFFADSLEHAVFKYDYDLSSGEAKNPSVLFTIEDGVPDGMTIDKEDNLWLAVWGGSRIEKRSSRSGELLSIVSVPAKHTSSCCFIDDRTLFITSSGEGLSGEYDGAVFTCSL